MSIIYMYHSQDPQLGGTLSTGNGSMISLLDFFNNMYGGERACIHPGTYQTYTPNYYTSLYSAHFAYPLHTWVYLDASGEKYLDEFIHPKDNVVYVVGDDANGFEKGIEFKGPKIKLRTIREGESFAIACLISVIHDRWSKKWQ